MLRKVSLLIIVMMLGAILAACGGQAATPTQAPQPTTAPAAEPTAAEPTASAAEPTAAPATSGSATAALSQDAGKISQELADAFAGKYKGTSVTMTGPFVDEDAVKFNNAVKEFEDMTGIDIQYEGTKEFEANIKVRVDGGNPPDIADFPQPGLLATFVAQDKVVDVGQYIKADWLKQNYNQSWLDMATMANGSGTEMAGVWQRVNGKSLVWYPKKAFDAAGYKIPQTWDELMALTDQIAADGDTAWCIGIESGAATGWPATDWVEEIMLRTTSLDNYDKWVKGELKFDSPEVKNAIQKMSEIWFNDQYVYGGRASIVTTNFGDAPTPMFSNPPGCWLHKQGNFITSFFPQGLKAGEDYDFFYLPPIDPQYGKPVEVAGDLMAAFSDRPEVRAVMSFFSSGASVEKWLGAGGAVSPHADSSLDWYGDNTVERGVAEIIQNATSVRFDASDLMPGAVGAGSFWKGMTDYVAGTIDLDTAVKEIDAAWPQ